MMAARIVVIEDNAANLELMTYLLRAAGHSAAVATDGEAGLLLALTEMPDLILCDVQLPRLNGYDVARRARANDVLRATPIAAVTAFAMVGDEEKALSAGFNAHFSKPINPETFVSQVEALLPAALRST